MVPANACHHTDWQPSHSTCHVAQHSDTAHGHSQPDLFDSVIKQIDLGSVNVFLQCLSVAVNMLQLYTLKWRAVLAEVLCRSDPN